jgi:hypothetical protein
MALVSAEFSLAGVNTAGTSLWNLKATTTVPLRVLEVGIFIAVAPTTAPDLGIVRMNAVGTGAITSTAGAGHETGHTPVGVLETAWATTRPTRTGTRFRRALLPLTVGAGIIWQLGPNGIQVPVSGGLVLEQVSASGATLGTLNGYVVWDE